MCSWSCTCLGWCYVLGVLCCMLQSCAEWWNFVCCVSRVLCHLWSIFLSLVRIGSRVCIGFALCLVLRPLLCFPFSLAWCLASYCVVFCVMVCVVGLCCGYVLQCAFSNVSFYNSCCGSCVVSLVSCFVPSVCVVRDVCILCVVCSWVCRAAL